MAQYFYPIKSLYKWALKEDIVDVDPSERIDNPNNNKTVEESRWQAFNQNEIKISWDAVKAAWGQKAIHACRPNAAQSSL